MCSIHCASATTGSFAMDVDVDVDVNVNVKVKVDVAAPSVNKG